MQQAGRGAFVQVLLSGLIFGALHLHAFAEPEAALMAQMATTVLGWMLAGLYLLSGRQPLAVLLCHGY
ncbi:hypothetical protein NG819_14615 [Pseudarthrobacter sp. Fe7]|nr:hypothetical protein NG819_14615 [Pseudarthrobacter sp. Fe7]